MEYEGIDKSTMSQAKRLVLVLVVSLISAVEMSQDVMTKLSIHFAKPLDACKKEMDLPDSVVKEFANFWKEGYVLQDRNIGCAIMCLSSKLELYDEDYKLHHGNAQDLAKKHGADEATAKQLVDTVHGCMTSTPAEADACAHTVKVAQCFKDKIHEYKWAPDPDIIMAEMLAGS